MITIGEYRSPLINIQITRIGRHGKWAYSQGVGLGRWRVSTGEHSIDPLLNILARHDTDAELARAMVGDVTVGATVMDDPSPERIWAWGIGDTMDYCAEVKPPIISYAVEYARADTIDHWRQEVGKLHSQLIKARAERDEAVALCDRMAKSLASYGLPVPFSVTAFLAKIGGG